MKQLKINEHTLRALMHAGEMLRIAVESGDLSAREKYIAAWNLAFDAVMAEIEKGKK